MNRKNYQIPELAGHLISTRDLHNQGFSDYAIRTQVAKGELIKLRKGQHVPTDFWNSLHTHERYKLHLLAYHKMAGAPVFSHMSAAILQDLVVPFVPQEIHIYTNRPSNGKAHRVRKHPYLTEETALDHQYQLIATTALKTTIVDCAKALPLREAIVLADSAIYRGGLVYDELAHLLNSTTGYHCKKVQRVASFISKYAESPGETFVRLLLQEMGLRYKEQVKLTIDGKNYRVDFVLLDYPVVIEFDGRIKLTDYTATDIALADERTREVKIQNTGWFMFRTCWADTAVYPQRFKEQLWKLLTSIEQLHDRWLVSQGRTQVHR